MSEVLALYERESLIYMILSSILLVWTAVNFSIMQITKVYVPPLERLWSTGGSFFLSVLLLIIGIDPAGALHRLPGWVPTVLQFLMIGSGMFIFEMFFDANLRVILESLHLQQKFPSKKYTISAPMISTVMVTALTATLIGITNEAKFSAILGMYAAFLEAVGGVVMYWVMKIIAESESKVSKAVRSEADYKTIRVKLNAAVIVHIMITLIVFVASVREIVVKRKWNEFLGDQVPSKFTPTQTPWPCFIAVFFMNSSSLTSIFKGRRAALAIIAAQVSTEKHVAPSSPKMSDGPSAEKSDKQVPAV